MQVDEYLRLAFMLNNNQATSLRKNLEKMISLVLYDAEKSSNGKFKGYEVVDIIENLRNSYELEFSETEVFDAIKHNRTSAFICLSEKPKKFTISVEEIQRIDSKVKDHSLETIISEFIGYKTKASDDQENNGSEAFEADSFSSDEVRDILYKYFYTLFNSNASYIRSFLGQRYDTDKLSDSDFNPAEKKLINEFVYWENPEKDRMVYELVSCCFDYCMMTVKKDSKTYQKIFNNKVFYLDANVIFRLVGINRENRKRVISAFVNKCKAVDIKLKVTNFTRKEIDDTIDRNVERIRKVIGGHIPVSTRAIGYYASSVVNPDFYQVYRDWCNDPANQYNNYASFGRELKQEAHRTLSRYGIQYANCDSFKDNDVFRDDLESLIKFKQRSNRNASIHAAEVDVSNYLFVRKMNSVNNANDFFSTHHYLISADHAFGDWGREKVPNAVPIVVLPSVWYSIILQYAGRNTNDDYTAFTRFLNFSLQNGERKPDGIENSKLAILNKVLNLQEPQDIKDSILFNIEDKLQNNPSDADIYEDIDAIVEEGLESVTSQKVSEARKEEQRIAKLQHEADKEEYNRGLRKLKDQHEATLNELKADQQRYKDNSEKEKENAVQQAKDKYIDDETDRRTKGVLIRNWIITILLVAILCLIIYLIFHWIKSLTNITEKEQMMYDFFKYIVSGGLTIVTYLIIRTIFCGFDTDKIRAKVRQKVEREHRN
ncbi:MAG: hypothetical protein PUF49_08535 [Firmicutes bacterium]|nr:hypothetical protein [Bacillota bacterium]